MKCYVCKFVNQAAEARRHPNETTKVTAELLYKRLETYRKTEHLQRHLCETHKSANSVSIDLTKAWKDLQKAEARVR